MAEPRRLSDRVGRRPVILAGYLLYVWVLLGLSLVTQAPLLWGGSLLLGGYYGLTEGAERALVHDLAAPAERGTAFGWFHMIVGLAAIPGGLLLGGLWQAYWAQTPFLISAALAGTPRIAFDSQGFEYTVDVPLSDVIRASKPLAAADEAGR